MIQTRSAVILSVVVAFAIVAPRAHAQTAADSTAIKRAALDYIEGWYEGNAERMDRALHPELTPA